MTDSPELSVSPLGDSNIDSNRLPTDTSSTAPRRRDRAFGALTPTLLSAAMPRVQPTLVSTTVAPIERAGLNAVAGSSLLPAACAQLNNVVSFSSAWQNTAARTAIDVARAATLWENTAANGAVDAVRTSTDLWQNSALAWAADMMRIPHGLEAVVDGAAHVTKVAVLGEISAVAKMASFATEWQNSTASKMASFATLGKQLAATRATEMAMYTAVCSAAVRTLSDAVRINSGAAQVAQQMSSMWLESTRAALSLLKPQVTEILGSVASLGMWAQNNLAGWHEAGLRIVRAAVAYGDRVFFAVFEAQNAAMRGDRDMVAEFFDRWTNLPRSGRNARLQAGADVLLEVELTDFGPRTAFELVELIEKRTNRHYRRGRRMLGDTELNHLRVLSMEELAIVVGPEAGAGMLPKAPSAETRALAALNEFDNAALAVVVGGLTPAEAQITYARGFTNSWTEAALVCGHSAADARRVAERVRDKVVGRMKRMSIGPRLLAPMQGRCR